MMDLDKAKNAKIAEDILSRKAMARGIVVLDLDLLDLGPALGDANLKVVKMPAEWSDRDIKESLLPHRIVVTMRPAVFIEDAPVYEYGVISLDKVSSIDRSPSYRRNKTVQLLSKAMSHYKLWAKGAKFLLELRDDGGHVLKELI